MKMNKMVLVGLLLTVAALVMGVSVSAQETVVISLTVPDFMEDLFTDQIIGQFEAEHPGVRVHIVSLPGFGAPFGDETEVEEYLDAVEDYVSSADVLVVDSGALDSVATRAGYFLDLAPLVNSDSMMNSGDFYDAVWRSFQWDGGTWAIPVSVDATVLAYDPLAFDAAGLMYPNASWSIQDFEYAARTLTEFNADGSTAMPGFINFGGDLGALFLSLFGQGVVDQNAFPIVPSFDNADLEALLTAYVQMQNDGLMTIPDGEGFERNAVPMQLNRVSSLARVRGFGGDDNQTELMASVLPGSQSGLVVDAYAVSSGTQYPQIAYELVKFLSSNPEAVNATLGVKPARRSLQQVDNSDGGSTGVARAFSVTLSPELDAVMTQAIDTAIPAGEAMFSEDLQSATNQMRQTGLDAATVLDEVELVTLEWLAAADARRGIVNVVVDTPPDMMELTAGDIRLNFGIASFVSPLPNQEAWDQAVANFAATDPEVGQVIIESTFPDDVNAIAETYDCFYMETNIVQTADLSILLSIDPLLNSDPTFDPNDMVGNVMQQVQNNNQTWAMPLMVQPTAMRYNAEIFGNAGANPPTGTWTVDQFEDALQMLQFYLGDGETPFQPGGFDNSHWLMLIAAYGGLPLDYRTSPTTVNYTDPATVEAIRNVLDLAIAGSIEYSELAGLSGNFSMSISQDDAEIALYSEVLNSFTINGLPSVAGRGGGRGGGSGGGSSATSDQSAGPNNDILTTFPVGSQYSAVAYDLAAAYISSNTQYAEACYRFISSIAQNPEIIPVMPARRSLINSYELSVSQGESAIAFYNSMDTLMQQPNTINFPTTQIGGGRTSLAAVLDVYWLNRAFDRYVLEGANLETELADAEAFTLDFQECVAAIPPFDPLVDDQRTYFEQFSGCATSVDPTAAIFGR
jgi:ABC-type glycerol-3-phosphate transport system substrate-binding protein